MRKLTGLLAAVVAIAILWASLSDGSGSSAVATTAAHATRTSHATPAHPSAAGFRDAPATTRPGAATVIGSGTASVYGVTARRATATPQHITFTHVAAAMVSSTGLGHRSLARFVQSWAHDPLASSLPAVILTSDGVRHSVQLSYPTLSRHRLSFALTASATVPSGLAAETGVAGAGAVAGVTGTLRRPTLFLAVAAARTVHGCEITPRTDCDGRNLAQASLESTQLSNASLRHTNLWQAGLHRATLTRADLSGAGAYRADLSGVSADRLTAVRTQLTQATLSRSSFERSVFTRAVLRRADLTRTDFAHASMAHLQASDALARGASFEAADLRGARLMSADFTGADFRGADLRGADLAGANLIGADFTGADLTGANLDGAILRHTVFAQVTWGHTKCTDGIVRSSTCA